MEPLNLEKENLRNSLKSVKTINILALCHINPTFSTFSTVLVAKNTYGINLKADTTHFLISYQCM